VPLFFVSPGMCFHVYTCAWGVSRAAVGERAGVRMDRLIQGESQGNPMGEIPGGNPIRGNSMGEILWGIFNGLPMGKPYTLAIIIQHLHTSVAVCPSLRLVHFHHLLTCVSEYQNEACEISTNMFYEPSWSLDLFIGLIMQAESTCIGLLTKHSQKSWQNLVKMRGIFSNFSQNKNIFVKIGE